MAIIGCDGKRSNVRIKFLPFLKRKKKPNYAFNNIKLPITNLYIISRIKAFQKLYGHSSLVSIFMNNDNLV